MGIVMCAAMLVVPAGCGSRSDEPFLRSKVGGFRLLTLTAMESDALGQETVVRAFVQPEKGTAAAWYRFELYAFVPLDANPRGKRLFLWPEIEPGAAESANRHWRPHLAAYEFVLPVQPRPAAGTHYLFEVTALDTNGIRWTDAIKLTFKATN